MTECFVYAYCTRLLEGLELHDKFLIRDNKLFWLTLFSMKLKFLGISVFNKMLVVRKIDY